MEQLMQPPYIWYGLGGIALLFFLGGGGKSRDRRDDQDKRYRSTWEIPVWESPISMLALGFLFVLWVFWYSGHPIDLPGANLSIGQGRHFGDWIGPGSGSGGWGDWGGGGGRR